MSTILIAFLLSLLTCAFFIPLIIGFSLKLKLFDDQDAHRKQHKRFISRMGGIGIFLAYIICLTMLANKDSLSFHALVASTFIVFFLGLKDDLLGGASPPEKFAVQFLAATLVIVLGGFDAINLDFFTKTFDIISPLGNILNAGLLVVMVIFIINAFNFIDGINGLAGVLGVIVNVFLGYCFLSWRDYDFGLAAFVITGATCGFLIYNFMPNKVFMGDSGAMVIGLTTSGMCLRYLSLNDKYWADGQSSGILTIFALLIVPTFDVIRIFIIRSLHNKPLLVGDRNHIHHRLQDLGIKDFQVVIVLGTFTIISVSIVILGEDISFVMISIILALFCLLSNTTLSYFRGRRMYKDYKLSDLLFIDTLNRR
jgi:UDP-GlcNAc:undecaprenyl-phosphate GlcNAc-1-phosphate transferase